RPLPHLARFESRHFRAWSSADEAFTRTHLDHCELIYTRFFEHFRSRGFALQAPTMRLELVILDSPASFEAYLGKKMPALVTGVYQSASNRFVLYDYARNASLLAERARGEREGKSIGWHAERLRYLESVERWANDQRQNSNLTTVMHEVAHQLSFNTG